MNSYQTQQISQTISTVVISGILACTFLSSACTDEQASNTLNYAPCADYIFSAGGASLTCDPHKNFQLEYRSSPTEMELGTVVTNFFAELSSKQEPLGAEFEQVLFKNLWDLYQS